MSDNQEIQTSNIILSMPKFGKHDINKCARKFKIHFLDKLKNPYQLKLDLVSLAISCHLHEELIRPHSWKLFSKTLSFNEKITLRDWIDETYKKREKFKKELKEDQEKYILEEQNFNQSKTNKKFSNFEENSSLKHLIEIDVERTYGDTPLFKNEYIRRMEEDILFLFAHNNEPIFYKQGMNEILAIFIYSFYPFYIPSKVKNYTPKDFDLWCNNPEKYINEIYSFFHDENEFKSDLYYILYNMMNMGLNKLYEDKVENEDQKSEPKTYLLNRCDYILDKLRKYNLKLYKHFLNINLNAEIILQRWLKCIFSREYTPEDCIYIWDNVLANEFNIPSKNLEYIDYFCVAMFDYIGDNLLTHDQNECFLCLFKYPPFQTIDILVNLSEKVKEKILNLEKPKESIFSNIKNKLGDFSGLFNSDDNNINIEEQRKANILADLQKITNNKARIIQLKNILNKYRNKFAADDRMKIDLLINYIENNV